MSHLHLLQTQLLRHDDERFLTNFAAGNSGSANAVITIEESTGVKSTNFKKCGNLLMR